MEEPVLFKGEDVRRSLRLCGIVSRIIEGLRYLNPNLQERRDLSDILQVDCDFWIEKHEDDEEGEVHIAIEYINPRTMAIEVKYFGAWLNEEDNKNMGFAFYGEPLDERQLETIKKIMQGK